jgi:imidazoleglycerol phosphate dehydratase HisB
MTTPLGELTIGPREGRRVSLARSTRETTITITLGLDGSGST